MAGPGQPDARLPGRAFRYAKPGVRWFEVDHPATQRDKLERLGRLGLDASHVRFVEADFTRDPVARRLRAAGLDPDAPSVFLLEGVAVYLEPVVLEDVLRQATVAALGEPARSTFEPAEAEALLARTGWPLAAGASDGQPTAAGLDRLRAAGLLLASVGASPPVPPQPSQRPQPSHGRNGALPLSALLSQALVAFTIEFDNEAEHRLPHRTTSHGALAVAANVLRVLGTGGTRLRDLPALTGTSTASVRRPATLPHFPVVLHRGGYPDGS